MTSSNWALTPVDKQNYLKIFSQLEKDQTGCIPGAVAKQVLLKSKLDQVSLSQAWNLADTRQRGKLDKREFCICLHLIYKALAQNKLPQTIPHDMSVSVAELEVNNSPKIQLSKNRTSSHTLGSMNLLDSLNDNSNRTVNWVNSQFQTERKSSAQKLPIG